MPARTWSSTRGGIDVTSPRTGTLWFAPFVVVLVLTTLASVRGSLAASPCSDNETLCGDGGPATEARLLRPSGIATAFGGGFFVADTGNNAVRRVLPTGTITTVAGLGTRGYSGDRAAAVAAQLNAPADTSPVSGGSLLIADAGNGVIRRVSPGGIITTVAGAASGNAPSASPAPATRVRLSNPQGVAAAPGGGFLIADTGDNMVLRVSPAGLLRVVAGTGAAGNSGDGGPAVSATLDTPTRILPAGDGSFLILDLGNEVVRKVSADGTISTVPGSSTNTTTGVHGALFNPGGLARDAQGNIYVFDGGRVSRVSPNGVATPVVGTGECGSTGDGGPALDATLAQPADLAITASGLLIVDINDGADAAGNVRRWNASGGSIVTVAGESDTGASGCIGAGGAPSGALWPIFYITEPRSARALRPITIKFVTTRAAVVRTSLERNGARLRTVLRPAIPGSNSVTMSPGLPSGAYTMSISASGDVPNNNEDEGGTLHLSKQFGAPLRVGR